MKEILYTNFKSVSSLLGSLVESIDTQKITQQEDLRDIWPSVVGEKFALRSRPLSINKKGVLFVACESPMVTQELYMMKLTVVKRLEPYLKDMNKTMTDIAFSHKLWEK